MVSVEDGSGLAHSETWSTFEERLHKKFPDPRHCFLINFAYDIAKYSHAYQVRADGTPYYRHPRGCSLIAIDECGETDINVVLGTLLHDVGEDSNFFGHSRNVPYSEWIRVVRLRTRLIFGSEVANMQIAVTNPKVEGIEILTKEHAHKVALNNLRGGPVKAIKVKMYDRLHNLRELRNMPLEKQIEKIKETREDYFPIFELAKTDYPEDTEYLMSEMEKEMSAIEAELEYNNSGVNATSEVE